MAEVNKSTEAQDTPPPPMDFAAIEKAAQSASSLQPDKDSLKEARDFDKAVRSEIQRLVIYALRLGAAVLGVLLVVRFWHLGAPNCWRWLSDTEVQSMDKMLFSSAFGGFVFAYLKDTVFKNK